MQYEGIRAEHVAVRTGAGMFDVSHMGEIETRGPGAEALLQRLLSNDVSAIAGARRAVLGALPRRRRRARRPLHLPARPGPLPDRHQRRQPRKGPGLVPRPRGGARRRGGGRPGGLGDDRRAGPRARGALEALADGPLPARMRTADVHGGGRGLPRLRHRLHGRGRRRAARAARWRGRRLGRARGAGRDARRARRARHAAARGLLPPLRQRPLGGSQPARGRPGLVLQARHGLHRGRFAARSSRRRRSSRLRSPGRGYRGPAIRCAPGLATGWSRVVRSRPAWRRG